MNNFNSIRQIDVLVILVFRGWCRIEFYKKMCELRQCFFEETDFFVVGNFAF